MPDFNIKNLGKRTILSPLASSENSAQFDPYFINDNEFIRYKARVNVDEKGTVIPVDDSLIERAGPRKYIFFNPRHVHAAIVTCGGICPGLNNVIRAIVRSLWNTYGVERITGIRFGYTGFLPDAAVPPIELNPGLVDEIQEKGGSILGCARGGGERTSEIVDALERMNINILFTIGGDGTLRGADCIGEEIEKRGLKISVIGIPKTIDNDLSYIQTSFGFCTAIEMATPAVRTAHTEAKCAINGIGLVKVMGRDSGFIAAHTSLAQNDVNFCLIPESPFDLDGPNGFLAHLKKRILSRHHAVILVAEGAGQDLMNPTGQKDASGNVVYSDIGLFLKNRIAEYFKEEKIECNIKYIDPSYIIRASRANETDSIYCARLGAHAVHAAMAGKTQMLVASNNGHYTHIPLKAATSARNHIDVDGAFWRDVLENTRQPISMKN